MTPPLRDSRAPSTGHRQQPGEAGSAAFAGRLGRTLRAFRASLRARLVLVFLLLAVAMTAVFVGGVQRALAVGWRDAARPLLADYVDRLAQEVAPQGQPSLERAQALAQRLPVTVSIHGPRVNGSTHAARARPARNGDDDGWHLSLQRRTADGHTLAFGLDEQALTRRPRLVGVTLAALLGLTALAYLMVRRLLRPLQGIRAGAQRFGAGDFSQPIAVARPQRPDELGQLAQTLNSMGQNLSQLLEAKRALLLAISHELRSPLTRARLNTELLPETPEVLPQRQALLRDLQEMAALVTDLLESERLATPHAALQREPLNLAELAASVLQELQARHAAAAQVAVQAEPGLPEPMLDPARMRLLLRNLLDNALRHGAEAATPPQVHLRQRGDALEIEVRDFGPGVPPEHLAHLAEPFYRPDSARSRSAGGVGLGLFLCRLVAQAHGGTLELRNAQPGLAATVRLPLRVA